MQNNTLSDTLPSEQTNTVDASVSEEKDTSPVSMGEQRKRASKKDRSNGKYSQEDFLNLPREEQFTLAEKYWNGPTDQFDDGTFQFSYSQFGKLCEQLGFRKGIVDTASRDNCPEDIIYLVRGKRGETVEKKYTFSKETITKIDELLGSLGNMEKSKVLDLLLSQVLDEKLAAKSAGNFHVVYKAMAEEILL